MVRHSTSLHWVQQTFCTFTYVLNGFPLDSLEHSWFDRVHNRREKGCIVDFNKCNKLLYNYMTIYTTYII